ncbi:hypothetical protein [Klebsiella phage ST13-OXA48phi12.5]|nr:hypothetical protein [Klebsiella phage ST13-OXA48phi12.5]
MFITYAIDNIVLAIDLNNRLGYYHLIQTTTLAPEIGNNAPLAAIRQR